MRDVQVFNVVILVALVENILRPDQEVFTDPNTGRLYVKDSDQSLQDKVRRWLPLGLPLSNYGCYEHTALLPL